MTFRTSLIAGALILAAAIPASAQTAAPTSSLKKPATTTAAPAAPVAAPAAKPPAPAMAPAADAGTGKKPPSEAQKVQQAKMKTCATQWNGMKKAGKTNGMTYRQFSSECLKG